MTVQKMKMNGWRWWRSKVRNGADWQLNWQSSLTLIRPLGHGRHRKGDVHLLAFSPFRPSEMKYLPNWMGRQLITGAARGTAVSCTFLPVTQLAPKRATRADWCQTRSGPVGWGAAQSRGERRVGGVFVELSLGYACVTLEVDWGAGNPGR